MRTRSKELKLAVEPFFANFFSGNDKAFISLVERMFSALFNNITTADEVIKAIEVSLAKLDRLCESFHAARPFNYHVYKKTVLSFYKMFRDVLQLHWNSMIRKAPQASSAIRFVQIVVRTKQVLEGWEIQD